MKKFKLTDETGQEYWLNVSDGIKQAPVWIEPIEPVTPEPEIKVGMWVIGKDDYYPHEPVYVKRIAGDVHFFDLYGYADNCNKDKYARPATPAEIESHLKKVCEKYVGTHRFNSSVINKLYNPDCQFTIDIEDANYNIKTDMFKSSGIILYEKGKFIEILPDLKKKPETRDEFEQMFKDYLKDSDEWYEFLNQYDI